MRNLVFAAAVALSLAASPAADARQQYDLDYGEQSETRLNELDELIDWIDRLEADLDSGSLLMIRPSDVDGGLQRVYVPVDREEVIRAIRLKVALGEITSQQGAAFLIGMASDTARYRREFRAYRDKLAAERRRLREGGGQRPSPPALQPWELGRPPAQPAAPRPSAACPAASRWQIQVQGSQYPYHFVLVIREDGSAAVVLPSGEVMDWVQAQARVSGNTLTLQTYDVPNRTSGGLTATLAPDCSGGTGYTQGGPNTGPATLVRVN